MLFFNAPTKQTFYTIFTRYSSKDDVSRKYKPFSLMFQYLKNFP